MGICIGDFEGLGHQFWIIARFAPYGQNPQAVRAVPCSSFGQYPNGLAEGERKPKIESIMRWYHYISYFFGGAFVANALPHLGNGISGHPFQSPFATPPGEGLSSSTVNVLWGLFNLAIGYLLVCRVGNFELRKSRHVLVLGVGILVMSILLAHTFGRFHGGVGPS